MCRRKKMKDPNWDEHEEITDRQIVKDDMVWVLKKTRLHQGVA